MNNESLKSWYEENKKDYNGFKNLLQSTLGTIISQQNVDILNIEGRVKTLESLLGKVKRKGYSDPKNQVTDMIGLRVITYLESDVSKIAKILSSTFEIQSDQSVDKSEELGEDKFGYRSVHFICKLDKDRANLQEFKNYKDIYFEVQIRTILQHSWAEIEHDRGYKFSLTLPKELKRRFALVAGLLEVADREFDQIVESLNDYEAKSSKSINKGDLDFEITLKSLKTYFEEKHKNLSVEKNFKSEVVEELRDYGIKTIKDLDLLLSGKDIAQIEKNSLGTILGFLRQLLLEDDIEKYFEKSWNSNWQGIDRNSLNRLRELHGAKKVSDIIRTYRIDELDNDEYYDL
tara:strand:+ start:6497 stop:7534 length:1038 start_codon:yes stop_codon:yes gene_type:complete